jgi:7,8-dihydroneopterin aldolase/epimerase/oxygenase
MSGGFAPSAGSRLRLVFVRGLALQARLGVHPHERAAPQRVVVGVELATDVPEV